MNDRPGTLTIDGERATMTFARRLPYPAETVWAPLTDPAVRPNGSVAPAYPAWK